MAVFEVSNLNDDGDGSLRQAIAVSNAQAGADEIVFADSLTGGEITLTSGQLQISDDLNISGLGSENLTVSGNNSSRVLVINDGDDYSQINVEIDGLTITNGVATTEVFGNAEGGGIFNANEIGSAGEIVKITNSNIQNNQGGGIFNSGNLVGSQTNGKLELQNSVVSGNTERGVSTFSGAETVIEDSSINNNLDSGIASNSFSETKVINSRVNNNSTEGNGGGIDSFFVSRVEVIDSTISNNNAQGDGGGISNNSNSRLTVTNSIISGNTSANGGGIANSDSYSNVTIDDSFIRNNSATSGGGVFAGRLSTTEANNSFIFGNSAENSGGGLFVFSKGSAELTNTDLFLNQAEGGGAIFKNPRGNLRIIDGIITLNKATVTGGVSANAPVGYGIPPEIGNTIIAQNIGGDFSGEINSLGGNFIGNSNNGNDVSGMNTASISEQPVDSLLNSLDDSQLEFDRNILIEAENSLMTEEIDTDIIGAAPTVDDSGDGAEVDLGASETEFNGDMATLVSSDNLIA